MEEETTELREHAARLVSDSIDKAKEEISTKMAGDKNQLYGPPTIPETPSKTINDMLKTRCDKQFNQPIKFGIVFYVCAVFSLITKVYGILYTKKTGGKASHSMWMVSCGIVGALIIVKSYLLYNVMMACSFLAHFVLYYICVIFALVGIGLGISGMLFFDKQAASSISAKISSTFQSTKSSISSDKKMG